MIVESGIVATLLAPPVPSAWYGYGLSHPRRRVRWCDRCCSEIDERAGHGGPSCAAQAGDVHVRVRRLPAGEPRRQRLLRPVSRSHPERGRPGRTARCRGSDLRRRRAVDGPRAPLVGGVGGHLAAVLRGQGLRGRAGRGPHPGHLRRVPHDARGRVRGVRGEARARWSHRRQRRQPRPQALPVALGRCRRHPAGPARAAAPRRGDLAEGPRRRSELRVGLVQEPGQPGAPRPHRARRGRQQGPLRPSAEGPRPADGGAAVGGHHHGRRVHGRHPRRVGAGPRERHARRPPGPFPSSCPSG